jgi:hypothetical protein
MRNAMKRSCSLMSLLLLLGVMTPAQTADRPAGFLAEGTPFATP